MNAAAAGASAFFVRRAPRADAPIRLFCFPFAGGGASIGAQAALDVPVTKPHQRSPFVAGSAAAVARYDEAYQSARG